MRPFGHILFRPVAARILETNTMQTNATRPLLALLGIAILSSSLQGAVAEGENLLINGGLEAEQVGFPEFWSPSSARDVIYYRRYGIGAVLDGAEILSDKSFVHVDRRTAGTNQDQNVGKINLHRIIFRAKSPTQRIAFDDEEAIPGEELIVNFVQLKPYLE